MGDHRFDHPRLVREEIVRQNELGEYEEHDFGLEYDLHSAHNRHTKWYKFKEIYQGRE